MDDLDADVKQLGFVKEAEALLAIAQTLQGRPDEEACAIMAAVSSILGFYDQAREFLAIAQRIRAATLQRELDAG